MLKLSLVLILNTYEILSSLAIKSPPKSWYNFEANFSEMRSAENKFNSIWHMLKMNGEENPQYCSWVDFLRNLNFLPLIPGMKLSLLTSMSLFRPWHIDYKVLHTRPAYASVKIEFNDEAFKHYNGLFAAPLIDNALMSISPGFKLPNMTNFFAFSIRLFRDNAPAGAIIAAFNALSHPNWNIYEYMVCTHYNWLMALPLALLTSGKYGQGWTRFFSQFGLSNLAQYNITGAQEMQPKFPWALCFIPNDSIREKLRGTPASNDAVNLLSKVQQGDILYDIWAIKEPYPLAVPALLDKYSHRVGTLIATSSFFTSTYGSQRLLGTHQRFEQDLIYRPDWLPYTTPIFLSRSGAVGVYSPLFRRPDPDIVVAQKNLLIAMTGVWNALTTSKGFQKFVKRLGITPSQLYDSISNYLINDVSHNDSFSPILKRSPDFISNTIQNVAQYFRSVGLLPPLFPLQFGILGQHEKRSIESLKTLISETWKADYQDKDIHMGNTLFASVKEIPFNLDSFDLLINE